MAGAPLAGAGAGASATECNARSISCLQRLLSKSTCGATSRRRTCADPLPAQRLSKYRQAGPGPDCLLLVYRCARGLTVFSWFTGVPGA